MNRIHVEQLTPTAPARRPISRYAGLIALATVLALAAACPAVSAAHVKRVVASRLATAYSCCPFCSAINQTFTEQIGSSDIVVIAKLVEAAKFDDPTSTDLPQAQFEIAEVIKGKSFVTPTMKFRTVLVGTYEVGETFLVMGVDPPTVIWTTPMKSSPGVIDYIRQLDGLPESGADRLAFFQDFFENEESLLAFDAYDEFARASYADLVALKDRMPKEKLLAWIADPEIAVNRRRLYFTMLGVCGGEADVPMLEELIRSGDRQKQAGLDALIGCYLVLKGEGALPLIEERLLANKEVDYVDTLSAVTAIRFMGTESKQIPRERLCQSLRVLLQRPELADIVVPDLARWEDWSVIDRLETLFREAKNDSIWLRVAIFQYLQTCPLPAAKTKLDELGKLDPKALKRATFFGDFGFTDEPAVDDANPPASSESGAAAPASPEASSGSENAAAEKGGTGANGEPGGGGGEVDEAGLVPVSLPGNGLTEFDEHDPAGQPAPGSSERAGSVSDGFPVVSETAPPSPVLPADQTLTSSPAPTPGRTVGKPPVSSARSLGEPDFFQVSGPIGQSSADPAVATMPVSRFFSLVTPLGSGLMIFLLLWSVINGWFERLVF